MGNTILSSAMCTPVMGCKHDDVMNEGGGDVINEDERSELQRLREVVYGAQPPVPFPSIEVVNPFDSHPHPKRQRPSTVPLVSEGTITPHRSTSHTDFLTTETDE